MKYYFIKQVGGWMTTTYGPFETEEQRSDEIRRVGRYANPKEVVMIEFDLDLETFNLQPSIVDIEELQHAEGEE